MHGRADQPEATTTCQSVEKFPFALVADFFSPLSSSSDFLNYSRFKHTPAGEILSASGSEQGPVLHPLSEHLTTCPWARHLTPQLQRVTCSLARNQMWPTRKLPSVSMWNMAWPEKKKKMYCVCPSGHHYINVKKTLIRPFAVLPNVCTSLTDQP